MNKNLEMRKTSGDCIKSVECGVQPSQATETKLYKKRWLVLAIFVVYSASNAMQWIQYSIISNIVREYYNVSGFAVDMTSMVFMISYIIFIFPASYVLDKFGLRYAALIGCIGTAVGSWIKVFSVAPDRFWVTFVGHTFVAVSQSFILSMPARLAAVWFGPDQVSSACSIGVFGNQLGVAIGFLFPPMMVPSSNNLEDTARGFQLMFYFGAGITSIITVLMLLFFQAQPSLPPSPAQVVQREAEQSENFFQSIKRLICNSGYILLLLSYAINVGIFYAISTMLNEIVLQHFPGAAIHSGRIGLAIIFAGMIGSVLCGVVLDKTHKFKETTLGVYLFSLVGMIAFTFTLNYGKIYIVYITAAALGFFMTGYLPVGFELAAELTYPEPEGTSAGLLNAMTQIFGIIMTILYRRLFEIWSDFAANISCCCVLALGTFITAMIPNDLRRQNAKI